MSCVQTFGRSDLQRIASLMERHQYVNGQHIITQGERGDHFFIVLEVSSHLPPLDIQVAGSVVQYLQSTVNPDG